MKRVLGIYANILGRGKTLTSVRCCGSSINFRNVSTGPFYLCKPKGLAEASPTSLTNFDLGSMLADESEETHALANFGERVANATDVTTLLELTIEPNLQIQHLSTLITHLAYLVKKAPTEKENVFSDPRFGNLCEQIQNQSTFSQHPVFLLQTLHGFYSLNVSPKSNVVQWLENDLKWMVRKCSIRFVSRAVQLLSTQRPAISSESVSADENEQPDALAIATENFQKRWVEVYSASEFISAFSIYNQLDPSTRTKLEDRALELAQGFTYLEIIKVIIALGNQKRRPTPLLRALSFHLSKKQETVDAKDLIELLYAINELSFADPVIMPKICNDLYPNINEITNPALISSLVTSLGRLRYKHKELMTTIDEWIMKHLNELRDFDYATWLMTTSVLNWRSENTEKFCLEAKSVLSKSTKRNSAKWLNIVYSLAIMHQEDPETISSVLAPDFVSQIESAGTNTGVKIKLLHLNALGKSMKNYEGPFLPDENIQDWMSLIVPADEKLSQCLVDTLSSFLPMPKYLKTPVKYENGVFVDAICKFNEKMEPVRLDTSSDNSKEVAFFCLAYPLYTTGDKEPTGPATLQIQLLQNNDLQVVVVPYVEFHPQDKLVRRVKYLEEKLRNPEERTA